MLIIYLIISLLFFLLAYLIYGKYLIKKFELNDENPTPAHTMKDNIDFIPTRPIVLLGHHFSSIAGAGPIIGPIMAAALFGWFPAFLWIIIGTIFFGGIHDYSSVVVSIRHKAKSIAEIIKEYLGIFPYKMFLFFIWLTLVYVLIVFLDLTAITFVQKGSVATASIVYIILAVIFGFFIYKLKTNLSITTLIFVILIFLTIIVSQKFPLSFPVFFNNDAKYTVDIILIVYAFFASILPVWLLLQPRDYLSSFLLYSIIIICIIGLLFGGYKISYPAFTAFSVNNQSLFPVLFVTIACGAISGFHSLVGSGTTSKQLNKEKDAFKIGYGAMIIEGILAILALATIMILSKEDELAKASGPIIFSKGISKFLSLFNIPVEYGESYGLLVLSAFLITTLDTATRISRYILQEFFNWDIKKTRIIATFLTIILPLIITFTNTKDAQGNPVPAYKIIWPIFGTTNQLLAALTLLAITLWLAKIKKNYFFVLLPMIFMLIVTLTSLFNIMLIYKFTLIGIIDIILFILAIYLVILTFKKLYIK